MWETDGTAGHLWIYTSQKITYLFYKYFLADCYNFSDMYNSGNIERSGWIKTKYMRKQENMEM